MSEVLRNLTEKVHISNLLRARLARMPRQIREIQPRNEKTTTYAIFRYRLDSGQDLLSIFTQDFFTQTLDKAFSTHVV